MKYESSAKNNKGDKKKKKKKSPINSIPKLKGLKKEKKPKEIISVNGKLYKETDLLKLKDKFNSRCSSMNSIDASFTGLHAIINDQSYVDVEGETYIDRYIERITDGYIPLVLASKSKMDQLIKFNDFMKNINDYRKAAKYRIYSDKKFKLVKESLEYTLSTLYDEDPKYLRPGIDDFSVIISANNTANLINGFNKLSYEVLNNRVDLIRNKHIAEMIMNSYDIRYIRYGDILFVIKDLIRLSVIGYHFNSTETSQEEWNNLYANVNNVLAKMIIPYEGKLFRFKSELLRTDFTIYFDVSLMQIHGNPMLPVNRETYSIDSICFSADTPVFIRLKDEEFSISDLNSDMEELNKLFSLKEIYSGAHTMRAMYLYKKENGGK